MPQVLETSKGYSCRSMYRAEFRIKDVFILLRQKKVVVKKLQD